MCCKLCQKQGIWKESRYFSKTCTDSTFKQVLLCVLPRFKHHHISADIWCYTDISDTTVHSQDIFVITAICTWPFHLWSPFPFMGWYSGKIRGGSQWVQTQQVSWKSNTIQLASDLWWYYNTSIYHWDRWVALDRFYAEKNESNFHCSLLFLWFSH